MNKNTIPAGLLAILFVIAMIWEIIKIIWPALVAIVIGIVLYYSYSSIKAKRDKKKKELDDKKSKIEKQIKQYEADLLECEKRLNNNPNDAYTISYKEQIPYFIDNLKIDLSCISNNKISISERNELDNRKQNNSSFLTNYTYTDKESIDQSILNKHIQLNNSISSLSKSDIWRIVARQKSSYLYFWSSTIKRDKISFEKAYFNKVVPACKCDVYSISILGTKFYFYPKYVIQAKSSINYRIIDYSQLSLKLYDCIVVEESYKPRGGTSIGYTYEHTCVDGTPDLRYKYNKKYTKYKYGYLNIMSLDNFRIDIAYYDMANDLYKAILDMKHTAKRSNKQQNTNQNSNSPNNDHKNGNNIQPSSAQKNKSVSKERIEFQEILRNVIGKEGKDIIEQKRFIYILEDLHAFQEAPHIKHILKLMQGDGYMHKLLIEDEITIMHLLSVQLSQKYMLQVDAVNDVFEDLITVLKLNSK